MRQVLDVLGESYDHKNLNLLALAKEDFKAAKDSFNNALQIHRQSSDLRGEAYALRKLGELQVADSKLTDVEQYFTRAISLHQEALDIAGEAVDLQELGYLQIKRSQWEKAAVSYKQVLVLHMKLDDPIGAGYDAHWIHAIDTRNLINSQRRGRAPDRLSPRRKRRRSGLQDRIGVEKVAVDLALLLIP